MNPQTLGKNTTDRASGPGSPIRLASARAGSRAEWRLRQRAAQLESAIKALAWVVGVSGVALLAMGQMG